MRLISSMWPSCSCSIALAASASTDTQGYAELDFRPAWEAPSLYMGPVEEASAMPPGDPPKIAGFRSSTQLRAGKVPEAGKGTTRADGGARVQRLVATLWTSLYRI